MLRKLILLFPVLMFCLATQAQSTGTIKGTVMDSTGTKLDGVAVVQYDNAKNTVYTDKNGFFLLNIPAGKKITIVFSSLNVYPIKRAFEVKDGETLTFKVVMRVNSHSLDSAVIKAKRNNEPAPGELKIKSQQFIATPNESFESGLAAQALGVHQTNELSSSYSVRGGNFDENLVYVNDFEIYRPYLVRSAQQEGLSFINPDMVGSAKFSSGGFQAKYGDKMSSVLDVTYRMPDSLHGSFYASLLGFGGHIEGAVYDKGSLHLEDNQRFTYSIGVRQRLSQYILGSLDTKGEYNPNFLDVQGFFTFRLSEKWGMEALTNYTRNQFNFVPANRTTTFGLLTDVKSLQVYYDGQEGDQYESSTNGLSLVYKPNDNLRIKFLGSYTLDREKEAYDIIGEYFLSEVQSDLGASNFGQALYGLGTGGIQNWGRNTLNIDVYYGGVRGSWFKKGHNLQWGADYKREVVSDKISEWDRLDSAGYSLPYNFDVNYNNLDSNGNIVPYTKNEVDVNRVLKTTFALKSDRVSGFVQDAWKFGDSSKFNLIYGVRFEYWDVNKEPVITPRIQFSAKPKGKADIVITASTGLYYQPPFYREMRNDYTGVVNTSLKAQKSYHAVVGFNYSFKAWHRDFNFTAEAYYKYMWDLVPYTYSDVQIKYLGTNAAKGYAYGLDMRLNGELAKGAESWISMSLMHSAEILPGVYNTAYFDSAGNELPNSANYASKIADSTTTKTGYFPRPNDQLVTFNMFFQDYIPKFPFIKLHINLVFATGLPFGAPGAALYKDTYRMPFYRRVDMGFSGQLWDPSWAKRQKTKFNQGLKGVWLSLEVFNIFGITNTVSYLWIRDSYGDQYAVPNYLTSRRVNAKLIVNF
ncbi:MAG TPA: carboxypeptidase-like regulatory domain-containing protein [Chitinophagales bacterium]|nr:carboxypeptidase-like regulatory domain-containing protein [Chitinophagales bacterium]